MGSHQLLVVSIVLNAEKRLGSPLTPSSSLSFSLSFVLEKKRTKFVTLRQFFFQMSRITSRSQAGGQSQKYFKPHCSYL